MHTGKWRGGAATLPEGGAALTAAPEPLLCDHRRGGSPKQDAANPQPYAHGEDAHGVTWSKCAGPHAAAKKKKKRRAGRVAASRTGAHRMRARTVVYPGSS